MQIYIYVPFINHNMVEKFFVQNPNIPDMSLRLIDNRGVNQGLPHLYNQVIERHLHEDCWLFFVHEDFEILEKLPDFDQLSRDAIYGTFGTNLSYGIPVGYGQHTVSMKDGSDPEIAGLAIDKPTRVQVLDCQSILLHSALLRDLPKLRFEERLTFDLYAEDLCMNAYWNFGVPILVIPLKFQHYSKGKVGPRYWKGVELLARKYPDIGVAAPCSFLGGQAAQLEQNFTYDIAANRKANR